MNEIKLLTVYRQEMHRIQIKNGFTDEQMTSYRQGFMDAIREYERRIATDVQPIRHGRWYECYTDTHHYSGICSVCGKASIKSLTESLYKYCPNCGARMDGDTE